MIIAIPPRRLDIVKQHSQDGRMRPAHERGRLLHVAHLGRVGLDHQQHMGGLGGEEQRVGDQPHRRSVDHHQIEHHPALGDEIAHALAGDHLGRIGRDGAAGYQAQIGHAGLVDHLPGAEPPRHAVRQARRAL